MHKGFKKNEHGVLVSIHECGACGTEFTVCPGIEPEKEGWENCLLPECGSYDPERDVDVVFMSDKELAERDLISMNMLRKRKRFQSGEDIFEKDRIIKNTQQPS